MVTLRRGCEFVYVGCATYWDPEPGVREQMRAMARRVGEQLRHEVDFRGTFTVDGVSTSDGFQPTELNPRFGAGIMTMARGAGIPMVLVNDLVIGGHDIGRTAAELESDVLSQADQQRSGGTWKGGVDVDAELESEPVHFADGAWSWAEADGPVAGRVTAGAGSVRCVYDHAVTPIGPSTGSRTAAFWNFAAAEFGTDTAGLTPARPSTPLV
jgi:hypothetical protein